MVSANANGVNIGYRYDEANRLASVDASSAQILNFASQIRATGYTYDFNGNTTVSFGLTAQSDVYDFEDRLIIRHKPDGSTINLSYDADGLRRQKTLLDASSLLVSATGYLLDGNNPTGYAQVVEEYKNTAAGTTSSVYTYGTNLVSVGRIIPNAPSAVVSYFTYDGLGSVRQLTDATGAVTDTWDYDAFGNIISRTGTTENAYLYRGEQYDTDLGMYSLRARFYNPNTGRFWNQDSYEGSAGDEKLGQAVGLGLVGRALIPDRLNFYPADEGPRGADEISVTFAVGVHADELSGAEFSADPFTQGYSGR